MRSVEENSPELANEWGPDNGSLTPQNVSYGSNKSIQWIGKCEHTWITSPKARAHGEGCPYCAGKKILTGFNDLKSQYPELAEEWSDKNELHSDMVTTGSSKKVWWKCHICGYEWRAVIKNRVGGSGCPNCVNRILIKGKNDFATLHPDKALDWSEKNFPKKPNMFLEFSNYRAWWKCHVCGYEWQAPIANRSGGSKCMCCSGMRLEAGINDLATTNPELAEEWSVQNGDLTPAMYKENSREMIWWTCRECGNEWRASIYSRSRGGICPYCSEKIRRENSVFRYRYRRDMIRFENNIRTAVIRFYMKKYGICVEYDTEELIGVSLDMYFPEKKGVLILSKDFHENLQGRRIEHAKNEMVRKKGLRLIRILEPGFRSFDDCACISCADDTLESFDAYNWSLVENKQRFISQVTTSKAVSRTCEDIDEATLSYAEIKAVATGNPLIKEKMEIDNDVQRVKLLKASYDNQRYALQDNFMIRYPKLIRAANEKLACVREDIKLRDRELLEHPDFSITVGKFTYTERADGGAVMLEAVSKCKTGDTTALGSFHGFQLLVEKNFMGVNYLILRGKTEYKVELSTSPVGNMVKLENCFNGIHENEEYLLKKIEQYENDLAASKEEYEKTFMHEEELLQKLSRQFELNAQLDLENEKVADADLGGIEEEKSMNVAEDQLPYQTRQDKLR